MADVRFIKVSSLPNNGIPFATYFVDNGTHYSIHQANEAGVLKPEYYDFLPDRTGNNGKVLTLVAGELSWEISGGGGLPDQTGNGGKVLMTDGTNAFWADVLVKRRGVIDGGEVSWTGSGLNYNVNYVDYYLESFVPFHTDPIVVTSPPSDPALNRFDIVVVDDQEDVYIVAGTPAADPVKPQIDPLTQLELTTILIPAGATEPGGVSNVVIYDEHVEYDTTATWASSVNFDNATGPLQGLKCIQAGNFAAGNIMRFTVPGGGSINITEHSNFIFFVNLLANFSNSNGFQISFWSDAVTRVSSYLNVTNGNFGFSRTTLNAYQLINLPIASFTFTSSTVKIIEFRMLGASSSNFRMDFIQLQKGITSVIEAPVPNLQQVTSQGNTTSLPVFAESFNLGSNRGIFFNENLGGGALILYNSSLAPTFGAIGSVDGSLKFYKDLGGLTGIVTSTLAWPNISANRTISVPNESGTLVLRVNGVAAGNDGNVTIATLPDITGNANKWLFTDGTTVTWETLPDFILTSEKGVAGGVVPLNGSAKIDTIYLPDSILGQVEYQGVWNATTNSPAIPAAASGNKGHYYIVSVDGTTNIDGITDWKVGDWIISDGTTWTKVDNTDAISSFNGRTGAITLISSDVTTSLGYTPVTNARTISINGVSYDLSANRSWTTADILPSQSTHSGKFLKTDGTVASWVEAITALLTGYTAGSSIVALSSTDTILQGLQKLDGNKEMKSAVVTGSQISFTTPQTYNSRSSPSSSNITDDLTGARVGVVQKIYHNKLTAPTFPAGWILIGGVSYVDNELNIIYCEWITGTTVEYWIAQDQ